MNGDLVIVDAHINTKTRTGTHNLSLSLSVSALQIIGVAVAVSQMLHEWHDSLIRNTTHSSATWSMSHVADE